MKRFAADALLIFALIVLGTMLDGAREEPAEDVNAQIAQFEEQVSLQRTWQGEAGSPMFYEVQGRTRRPHLRPGRATFSSGPFGK